MLTKLLIGTVVAVAVTLSTINVSNKPVQETVTLTNHSVTNTEESVIKVPVITNLVSKQLTRLTPKDDQVVTLYGEVGDNAEGIANSILEKSIKNPVYLLINSPGGSVLDGARILSAMEAAKSPVYTVCLQLCASMAAIIHQYGTERYMVDRSILMFHPASGSLSGNVFEMQSRLNWILRYTNKADVYIANRVGITVEQFKAQFDNEIWIDAEDSLNRKFTDKIVSVTTKQPLTLLPVIGNSVSPTPNKVKESVNFR